MHGQFTTVNMLQLLASLLAHGSPYEETPLRHIDVAISITKTTVEKSFVTQLTMKRHYTFRIILHELRSARMS